jgi:hypothetical protein
LLEEVQLNNPRDIWVIGLKLIEVEDMKPFVEAVVAANLSTDIVVLNMGYSLLYELLNELCIFGKTFTLVKSFSFCFSNSAA